MNITEMDEQFSIEQEKNGIWNYSKKMNFLLIMSKKIKSLNWAKNH